MSVLKPEKTVTNGCHRLAAHNVWLHIPDLMRSCA